MPVIEICHPANEYLIARCRIQLNYFPENSCQDSGVKAKRKSGDETNCGKCNIWY